MNTTQPYCWACNEELVKRQQFCKACNHWQNWRHYTVFSSTILSLLVALITVLGFLGPQIFELFKDKRVALNISGIYDYNYGEVLQLRLLAENWGDFSVKLPRRFNCDSKEFPGRVFKFSSADGGIVRIDQERSMVFHLQSTTLGGGGVEFVTPSTSQQYLPEDGALPMVCLLPFSFNRGFGDGFLWFEIEGRAVGDISYSYSQDPTEISDMLITGPRFRSEDIDP